MDGAGGVLLRWARSMERVDSHRRGGIGRASMSGAGVGCATLMNNYRPVRRRTYSIHCQGRLFAFSRSSIAALRNATGVSLSGPLRPLRHAPWEVHATNDALLLRRNPPTNRFIMQKVSRNKWTRRAAPAACITEPRRKVNAYYDERIHINLIVIYNVAPPLWAMFYMKKWAFYRCTTRGSHIHKTDGPS